MTSQTILPCTFKDNLCLHCGDTSVGECEGWVQSNHDLKRLPLFNAKTPHEEFMNAIIKYGVVNSCEWFGYAADSEFTLDTISVLKERLSEQEHLPLRARLDGKEVE